MCTCELNWITFGAQYKEYYSPEPVYERCKDITFNDNEWFKCIVRTSDNFIRMTHHLASYKAEDICLANGLSVKDGLEKKIVFHRKDWGISSLQTTNGAYALKSLKTAYLAHYRYLSDEEAAFKEGLSPEQYRHKLQLEQENARLREAQEEAERQAGAEQIYAQWLNDAEAVKAKYGVDFDMATEMENPQFTQLLGSGIPFEAAYKTVHFDDMLNGAMALTAQNVSKAMVNNIQSRSRRPAENGTQSATNTIVKADPSKFTDADFNEIRRRVAAGEEIRL